MEIGWPFTAELIPWPSWPGDPGPWGARGGGRRRVPLRARQLFSLSDPDRLAALADGAGFAAVEVDEHAVDFTAPDVDTHVDRVATLAGPIAAAFRAASPQQIDAVRQAVAEAADPFAREDGYVFPGRALVLTASRR